MRLVVTVKSYPQPSRKYSESVCVAGIRTDTSLPEWVRLYPILFRDLPADQQFKKWSEIELDVSKSSDTRPESVKPDPSTMRVLRHIGTASNWAKRMELVEPLVIGSMCEALQRQAETGASLAAFRPAEVLNVSSDNEDPDWSEGDRNSLSQMNLFAQGKVMLEKIPWRWQYHYSCGDDCVTTRRIHRQTIIDWEVAAAWRKWRHNYGSSRAAEAVRRKWFEQICAQDRDPVFLVGNQYQHLASFLVLGVCWPKKTPLGDLRCAQGRFDFAGHLDDDLSMTRDRESLDT
jgi:hypothetical protein